MPHRSVKDASAETIPDEEGTEKDDPSVLIVMAADRNRELLADTLGARYSIWTTTEIDELQQEFDCCVSGYSQFERVHPRLKEYKETTGDVFLPFVVLLPESVQSKNASHLWEHADDVIRLPVGRAELQARIGNLIDRRLTSLRLADREEQLEETVKELRLKERAFDKAPVGLTITGPLEEDAPLVYVNEQFCELTGYEPSKIMGRNCRFLQGDATNPSTRRAIAEALEANDSISVDILNYRKDGRKFWIKLDIAPVEDEHGEVSNFVGFQADITDRKIRERRLEVLTRVLHHNLRNKMNVILGHISILLDDSGSAQTSQSVRAMQDAATNLLSLSETVGHIQRTLDAETPPHEISVAEHLRRVMSALRDQYPDTTIDLTLPKADPFHVDASGIGTALEEAIENAIKHNDTSEPRVDITVRRPSDDWIEIDITDNGPGIPDQEINVLEEGETTLTHGDRLGLWLMYWIVSRAGGTLSITNKDTEGTELSIAIPAYDPDEA